MNDLLRELNSSQRKAVEHDLGPLLIIAGAMVATWDPYPSVRRRYDLHWAPYPSSNQGSAYLVPTPRATTKKCVNCGVELERIDQFCHACGTNVGWY